MAGPSFEEWISHLGLQQIDDPQIDKPVYRKRARRIYRLEEQGGP
jgi:hypothetical protein